MIHAQSGVPFPVSEMKEECVGRDGPVESPTWTGISGSQFIQLCYGWCDNVQFFAADLSAFAGVRIQARDRDARLCNATTAEEILEQIADADDFRCFEQFGNIAKGNVTGNERDGDAASSKEHGVVDCSRTRRKEFSLAGKCESDFCHSRFVDG